MTLVPMARDVHGNSDSTEFDRRSQKRAGSRQAASMTQGRVMLIARFDGDVETLTAAYDRAHDLIMSRGGAVPVGELRHHCATSGDALYIIGVWDSDEAVRVRWSSAEFKDLLESVGFPPIPAEMTILELHAIEPPLT
jgi:hypothetical protein